MKDNKWLGASSLLVMALIGIVGCAGLTDTTTTTVAEETTTTAATATTTSTLAGGTTTTTAADSSTTTTTSTTSTSESTTTTSTTSTTSTSLNLIAIVQGQVRFASTNDGVKGGVAISLTGNGFNRTTTADANGNYSITGLQMDKLYSVEASMSGWMTSAEVVMVPSLGVQNFSFFPISWEIVHIGGTTLDAITSLEVGLGSGRMLAVGGGSGTAEILKSTDGGTNWTFVTVTSTTEPFVSVVGMDQFGMAISTYALNGNGAIFNSSISLDDSGGQFGLITDEAIKAISFWSAGSSEIVTRSGGLVRREGNTFTAIDDGVTIANDVQRDMNNTYVAGNNGQLRWFNTGTSNWEDFGNISALTSDNLMAVFVDDNGGVATTNTGSIFTTANPDMASTVWQRELSGVPYALRGAFMIGSTLPGSFVVGENGLIMRRR